MEWIGRAYESTSPGEVFSVPFPYYGHLDMTVSITGSPIRIFHPRCFNSFFDFRNYCERFCGIKADSAESIWDRYVPSSEAEEAFEIAKGIEEIKAGLKESDDYIENFIREANSLHKCFFARRR
jgi:hypothetical protein